MATLPGSLFTDTSINQTDLADFSAAVGAINYDQPWEFGDQVARFIDPAGNILVVSQRPSYTLQTGEDELVLSNHGVVGTGNAGDNNILGNISNNELEGMAGDDWLNGSDGNDKVAGGAGQDTVFGGSGDDRLHGGSGDDRLHGGSGDDTVEGGSGQDTVFGGSGDDRLDGGSGDDTVEGGAGQDTVFGGSGDDRLHGGSGDDTVEGCAGQDTVFGGSGDDRLDGGSGADSLTGGLGNDTITGGAGEDTIIGGAGNDVMTGGAGKDVFLIDDTTPGFDAVKDFSKGDLLQIADRNADGHFTEGDDYNIQQIYGDTLILILDDHGDVAGSVTLSGVNENKLKIAEDPTTHDGMFTIK